MIAPVSTTRDLENDATQGTPTIVKDVMQDKTQDASLSELKTRLKRWKITGAILLAMTILFISLSTAYIIKAKNYKEHEEITMGVMMGEQEYMKNNTGSCMDYYGGSSTNGTEDRDLAYYYCPDADWVVGKGKSATAAVQNCNYYLIQLYGCKSGCGRSFNKVTFYVANYYVDCFCGFEGLYDYTL